MIKKLYLEITDKCNLDCTICYRKSWNAIFSDMEPSILQKIHHEVLSIPTIKTIVLGGIGEPAFAPGIHEAIERFKDYNLTITTNGTLMDSQLMALMVTHVDTLTISVDGLESRYLDIRGTELNRVTENIIALNRLKVELGRNTPHINLQFVASTDNIDDLLGVIDLASSLRINKVIVSNLLPQSDENADKIMYRRYENKKMKDFFNKVRNYSFRRGVGLDLPNYELKTERRCTFIEQDAAYVTASGDVVPCYRFSHEYDEFVFGRKKRVYRHTFGNVTAHTLQEIWDSKEYKDYRDMVFYNLSPSCIDCDLVEGCELVKDSDQDCYGFSPSCADCLWSRKLIVCP